MADQARCARYPMTVEKHRLVSSVNEALENPVLAFVLGAPEKPACAAETGEGQKGRPEDENAS
jgi:hypothetical protein